MQLEMFVNELSFQRPAPDIEKGLSRVMQLVTTITEASKKGVQRKIHVPFDYLSLPIAPDYNLRNWLADNRVDPEARRYFRSLATSTPFLNSEPEIETMWKDTDCYWQGISAFGLKAAYLADGLAISISSMSEWNTHLVECKIEEIVNNEISVHTEAIHHISSPIHIELHVQWINRRIQSSVENGQELWAHLTDFFPMLIFCTNVEKEMIHLPQESIISISKGLYYLNVYCTNWKTGSFNPDAIGCRVSPESQLTLQKFRKQHMFLCSDGQYRLFSFHAKFNKWRIYFNSELGPGQLLIGHVGKHLPISSEPK